MLISLWLAISWPLYLACLSLSPLEGTKHYPWTLLSSQPLRIPPLAAYLLLETSHWTSGSLRRLFLWQPLLLKLIEILALTAVIRAVQAHKPLKAKEVGNICFQLPQGGTSPPATGNRSSWPLIYGPFGMKPQEQLLVGWSQVRESRGICKAESRPLLSVLPTQQMSFI